MMLVGLSVTASENYTILNDTITKDTCTCPCDAIIYTDKQDKNSTRCLMNEKDKDGIIKNDSVIKENYKTKIKKKDIKLKNKDVEIKSLKKKNIRNIFGSGLFGLLLGLLIGL